MSKPSPSEAAPPEGLRIDGPKLAHVPDADLAYQLYYAVVREQRSEAEQAAAERAARRWIELGKHRVAVYAWGAEDGPAVLFAHGWNGHGTQVAPMIDALTGAGFRVWAFDGLGHGESTGRTTNVVQLGELIGALAGLAGEAGAVRGVIGHSLGGMAVSFALQEYRMERVRVALLASPYSFDQPSGRFMEMTGVGEDVLQEIIRRSEARTGRGWYDVSGETLIRRQTAPALLMHDVDDDQVPIGESERIHREWSGSLFESTRGLGHRRILASPQVAARIAGFLAEGG